MGDEVKYVPAPMLGKGIGDALGAPFEQPNTATEPPAHLANWDGAFLDTHGAYGDFKAGQWTDDTGMAVALAEALLESRGFSADTVMRRYFRWYESVPKGLVGGTIKKAMENYREGCLAANCGILGSEGNGTAMRCAPIGLYYWRDFEQAMAFAREDAALTHRSIEAEEGSAAVAGAVAMMSCMRSGASNPNYHRDIMMPTLLEHLRDSKLRMSLDRLPGVQSEALPGLLKEIGTKGHVLQTVPAAFACFLLTHSFEEAVLAAIRAVGDADTTAAITGALAGAHYGYAGIPDRFRLGVDRGDYLHELDRRLLG